MNKGPENIIRHHFEVTQELRAARLRQSPKLFWFTGLSGSGKSTISNAFEKKLFENGFMTYALDGDNVRNGICKDLTFSPNDRKENLRRIAEVAKLMLDAGLIVCASFISPFSEDRKLVKSIVGKNQLIEIHVSTSLKECEKRDPKGLYLKARKGEVQNFPGISSPYEIPELPDVRIDTSKVGLEESLDELWKIFNNK